MCKCATSGCSPGVTFLSSFNREIMIIEWKSSGHALSNESCWPRRALKNSIFGGSSKGRNDYYGSPSGGGGEYKKLQPYHRLLWCQGVDKQKCIWCAIWHTYLSHSTWKFEAKPHWNICVRGRRRWWMRYHLEGWRLRGSVGSGDEDSDRVAGGDG